MKKRRAEIRATWGAETARSRSGRAWLRLRWRIAAARDLPGPRKIKKNSSVSPNKRGTAQVRSEGKQKKRQKPRRSIEHRCLAKKSKGRRARKKKPISRSDSGCPRGRSTTSKSSFHGQNQKGGTLATGGSSAPQPQAGMATGNIKGPGETKKELTDERTSSRLVPEELRNSRDVGRRKASRYQLGEIKPF